MQPPQRYIPSVSDLYGTDEIEFLLDEIRDLEPACCQLEDIQDFEIAGSRAGELSISLESPLGTCTSWDSHVHYRQRIGNTPLPWGVALHCDASHLTSPTGIVRILLVISSAACLACECSAGTVQVGLFLLPLIGRLRLMIIGYVCSIEAVILAALTKCPSQYRHVIDDYSDMCLEERELSPICSNELTNIANNTTATTDNNNINATELSNHRNYNNNKTTETGDSVTPTCNQKPYIPVKRPDQSYNQRPTLGNMQKSNHRNRQGYHYQPIASTSRQSPTFVLDDDDDGAAAIPGPSHRSLDYSSA
ncbi:hypothetical protein RP20_CCG005371 [Aedes albopictus]|nr:hypothetical protein RP20_CCG005371 [Aedes albopictus]